jgi:hypothetical protein
MSETKVLEAQRKRGGEPAGEGGDEGRIIGEGKVCAKEGSALRWDYRRDEEQE